MSDTTPPVNPEPTPYAAAPAAPAAPAAGTGAKAPILSIVSLVLGIISFLGGWIVILPWIGSILHLFLPAGAVVFGLLGKSKEPLAPKGLWLTGLILGIIGLLVAIGGFIFWSVLVASNPAGIDYSFGS